MRILYGVTGEGLGHAMRAQVLLPHLRANGHQVLVAASGRAAGLLAREHDVVAIDGLHMEYANGAVQRVRTVMKNARGAVPALLHNCQVGFERVSAFSPEAVITDFDSFSYAVGRLLGCPIVSFDHQHVLSNFEHPLGVRRHLSYDFGLARRFVERKTRHCDRYVVTSFFHPEPRWRHARSTSLVGPTIRPRLTTLQPSEGEHVLVYQTAAGDSRLVESLRSAPHVPFRVYGLGARPRSRNIEYRAFDEDVFMNDLASARAVISNGGYTTLSEALFLGKATLSIPVRHQGEQELNAAYLSHLGLGVRAARPSPEAISKLLSYADVSRGKRPRMADGSQDAAHAVDRALAELS